MPAPPPTPPNEDMTQEEFDQLTEVLTDNDLIDGGDNDVGNIHDLDDFDLNTPPDPLPPQTPNSAEEP